MMQKEVGVRPPAPPLDPRLPQSPRAADSEVPDIQGVCFGKQPFYNAGPTLSRHCLVLYVLAQPTRFTNPVFVQCWANIDPSPGQCIVQNLICVLWHVIRLLFVIV